MSNRKVDGSWIQTFTGRCFWPLDPHRGDVAIEDIAHALSMICRYNGHTRRFYSVAEHSLLVCQQVTWREPHDRGHQLAALLHDAAEAYLCDIPRPVKPLLAGYKDAERRCEGVIAEALGLVIAKTPLIHELDTRILCDEAQALMPVESVAWHWRLGPSLGVEIRALGPGEAEAEFLEAFHARYRA